MKELQWAFTLLDRMSKNSDTITASLGRMEKQLSTTKVQSAGLQNVFGGFGGPAGTAVGALKMVAGAIFDIGTAIASSALDVISFKESTLVSFEAMTGSAQAAKGIFDRSMVFADITPFGSRDVVGQMKSIMGAGFDQKTAEDIFFGLADVAAVGGGGAPAMQAMLVQMAQAKAIGKFQMQDLKAIMSHAGPAGVSMDALFTQLSSQTGIDRKMVPAALTSGKINAETGINALMKVIQDKVSKGALGNAVLAQSQTIGGLSERVSGLGEKLLLGIDPSGSGITAIKGFLTNLLDTFDKLTGKGTKVQAFIQGMIDDFGGMFAGLTGPEGAMKMEASLGSLINGVMIFVTEVKSGFALAIDSFKMLSGEGDSMQTFVTIMRAMGVAVAVVAGSFAAFAGAIVAVANGFRDLWKLISQEMSSGKSSIDWEFWGDKLKGAIGGAVWGGVIPAANEAGVGMASAMSGGFSSEAEIHSPSRVFQRFGQMTAAGLALGIASGAGQVDASLGAMVAPPTAHVSSVGGRGVSLGGITIQINIDGAGKNADEIARNLQEMLPDELQKFFHRLAIETGEA